MLELAKYDPEIKVESLSSESSFDSLHIGRHVKQDIIREGSPDEPASASKNRVHQKDKLKSKAGQARKAMLRMNQIGLENVSGFEPEVLMKLTDLGR